MTIAIKDSQMKAGFDKYCDQAIDDCETIIVARDEGRNVVFMSESDYNNIMESLSFVRNKTNYNRILESSEQLRQGKGTIRELVNDE